MRVLRGEWNGDYIEEMAAFPNGINDDVVDSTGGCLNHLAPRGRPPACFADLPILADALEEAGCDNEAILTHCRAPASHVRGCWVLDLLLAKESGA